MSDPSPLGSFLNGRSLSDYIKACAQRALRGQTPTALRGYSYSFDINKKYILLKAEVERELTEEDRESLAIAETEVYSDFGDDTLVETKVEVIPAGKPLQPLKGGIAFLRDGEQYQKANQTNT